MEAAIRERRSVRKYTDEVPREGDIRKILEMDRDYELAAVVTVGVPEEGPTKGCRQQLDHFCI